MFYTEGEQVIGRFGNDRSGNDLIGSACNAGPNAGDDGRDDDWDQDYDGGLLETIQGYRDQ